MIPLFVAFFIVLLFALADAMLLIFIAIEPDKEAHGNG